MNIMKVAERWDAASSGIVGLTRVSLNPGVPYVLPMHCRYTAIVRPRMERYMCAYIGWDQFTWSLEHRSHSLFSHEAVWRYCGPDSR